MNGAAMLDPVGIQFPAPWKAVINENDALVFGRSMNSAVGSSVVGELRREICPTHPLFGVECQAIAYDSKVKKDFVFATSRLEMPVVLVHFTWNVENDPRWPFIIRFASVDEFLLWARKH